MWLTPAVFSTLCSDVVVQQLAPESKTGEANIDASTALTSKYNEKFLKDRLFKRKKARLTKPNNNAVNGGKKEEKPFLLFDPLLDKAPKKKAEAKPLTRAEMEERLRFRKSGKHPLQFFGQLLSRFGSGLTNIS